MKFLYLFSVLFFHCVGMYAAQVPSAPPDDSIKYINLYFGTDANPAVNKQLSYIRAHSPSKYKEILEAAAVHVSQGFIERNSFENYLAGEYKGLACIQLSSITGEQESFGGKFAVVRANELEYQKLLALLTSRATQDGFVEREYAQTQINYIYWRLRAASWYATSGSYMRRAANSTYNFLATAILPPLKSAYAQSSAWLVVKKNQFVNWYHTKFPSNPAVATR